MSLFLTLKELRMSTIYNDNITHNLSAMAAEAGIYDYIWQPEKQGITIAKQMIGPLKTALDLLLRESDRFKALNPDTRVGNYYDLVAFVSDYLIACETSPNAIISVSRVADPSLNERTHP